MLDPSAGKHRKETATTKTLTFTGGRAEFASDKIILDTLTIAKNDSGNYVEGTDYAVDYNFTKGTVIITSLKDDAQLAGSLTASFSEVDDSEIADSDIIGGVTSSGEYSGLSAIALLYPEQFAVCNLIAAPGWSHSPAVYNAMLTTCKFQSTPSARRATGCSTTTTPSQTYFNPRPPRGERQQKQRKNPMLLFHYTHLCTI